MCQNYEFIDSDNYFFAKSYAAKNDIDILIYDGNHKMLIQQNENLLLINPGTATGAYNIYNLYIFTIFNFVRDIPTASYVLIDIQKTSAVVYTYELDDKSENVRVNKFEHNKNVNI